jgi:hypothetical protein
MRGATYQPTPSPATQVVDALKTGQPASEFSVPTDGSPMPLSPVAAGPSASQFSVSPDGTPMPLNQITAPGATVPGAAAPVAAAPAATAAPAGGGALGNIAKYVGLASAASSLLSAPKEVQEAIVQLSPQQQEYFNRPSVSFDWGKLQRDAAMSGMSLNQYMANNWNRLSAGDYNTQGALPAMPNTETTGMYKGGALGAVSRFARGAGSGRDDVIDAKLSDGEYVIDAETVALLGDGSSKEGARRLEQMRKKIRQHKGKTLAKGKFSPNAKSPLAYIKGAR